MVSLTQLDYTYPPELVAQAPLPDRDAARLLVVGRTDGEIAHRTVRDLPALLRAGDLLVINDTKVLPLRLLGRRTTGGAVELLLLAPVTDAARPHTWSALASHMKRLRPGTVLTFAADLSATVIARHTDQIDVRFDCAGDFHTTLARVGHVPLPPYITRDATREDQTRYQTVYAAQAGSAAAPTAGLHFTEGLLAACRARGIGTATVTLHVGRDTFQPIRTDDVTQHRMHGEWYHVPADTLAAVQHTRAAGGRVIAVGTTSVRALESAARLDQPSGTTTLFLYPGYTFRSVDGLLTNFHQPRTTLLLLVSALLGHDRLLRAYETAIAARYRLFSYGDAMLIT